MDVDLAERLLRFAVNTIKFLKILSNSPEYSIIKYQLTKSASSAGANYEEAQAASSRADFKNTILISLREMRESNYWYKIINELDTGQNEGLLSLLDESEQLKKILGSICSKLQK